MRGTLWVEVAGIVVVVVFIPIIGMEQDESYAELRV